MATKTQGGLSSDFQSPFSIAIGGAYRIGSAKLHVTGEWFAPVDEFVVLPGEPFVGQSSGDLIDTAITRELTDVFNFAIGIDNRFSEKFTAYGSFRTDRSGFEESSEAPVPTGDWDIYHVAGGATFTIGRSELTTGAIVSYGDSTTGRVFEPFGGGQTSPDDEIQVKYLRFSFILGFNFSFK